MKDKLKHVCQFVFALIKVFILIIGLPIFIVCVVFERLYMKVLYSLAGEEDHDIETVAKEISNLKKILKRKVEEVI